MEPLEEFVDERQKSWCIHCGRFATEVAMNSDHVPTKGLLNRPLPPHTPQVPVCTTCNSGHSHDEEYFAAFLSCVLAGSTAPESQADPRMRRAFARNPKLVARLEAARRPYQTLDGCNGMMWLPEEDRIRRVVLKNARGHAFYELGEPMLDDPASVWAAPLISLTPEERESFFSLATTGWAEVGSRMLTRQASGADMRDGWIVVQPGVYRYAVTQGGHMLVRSILREYLATEVYWD